MWFKDSNFSALSSEACCSSQKVRWSKVADSVPLFHLKICVSQIALFGYECWHPGMMFFMQLPKVTLPQQCCKEIVTRDIPSEMMLHNSLTAPAGVWHGKPWQKNSLVSKPVISKQSARRVFFCFSWGGLFFWQNCHFKLSHTRGRIEHTALYLSPCFFLGAAHRIVVCSWTHKSNFEEKLLTDSRDSYSPFVPSYSLTTSWAKPLLAWEEVIPEWTSVLRGYSGISLQCPLSTGWLCDSIIFMFLSFS